MDEEGKEIPDELATNKPPDPEKEDPNIPIIRKSVISKLTESDIKYTYIQVNPLWERRYRVNVFLNTGEYAWKIVWSKFIRMSHDGTISDMR